MAIRSELGGWFAGAVIWVLGMTMVCVLIAFLTADSKFASVPGNILLLGALGGPLSTARCRAQFRWRFLSRPTLWFWVLSIVWSAAFLFCNLGAGTHYPMPLRSQIGFALVCAAILSVIGFVPDCVPRRHNAP
jgi:hypothetical protein